MKRRMLLVGLAVVLALIGTFAVYTYARTADNRAVADTAPKHVLFAHNSIAAGTTWSAAVRNGDLVVENVPAKSAPSSALTSLSEPVDAGAVALSDIAAGQIVLRESFGSQQAQTGVLSIPKGLLAISVSLSANADVAGYVGVQSQVVIFVTYGLNLPDTSPLKAQSGGKNPNVTRVLVPRVTVLAVSQAPTNSVEGAKTDAGTVTSTGNSVMLTLGVSQSDAERIIQAQSSGTLYLGLLSDSSQTSADAGVMDMTTGVGAAPIFVN